MYNHLYHRITIALHRLIGRVERSLNRLPRRTLWIGSVLVTVALSVLLVSLLFFAWKRPAGYLSINAIPVPVYVCEPPSPFRDSLPRHAFALHLQYLLYQLDSLRSHPQTRYLYDSLLRMHPGLRDSLLHAQNLFFHPFTITP